MHVFISGLTAAGKTTHSLLVAAELARPVRSAADALVNVSGLPTSVPGHDSSFWTSATGQTLETIREADRAIDHSVDWRLIRLSMAGEPAVFDAWGLPWLSTAPGLRIWLESSSSSRFMKSIVSHRGDSLSGDAVRRIVRQKDARARQYFLNTYAFDIFRDRRPFDVIIDVSGFIRRPHVASSRASIAHVQAIISPITRYYCHGDLSARETLERLHAKYGRAVFKRLQFPASRPAQWLIP